MPKNYDDSPPNYGSEDFPPIVFTSSYEKLKKYAKHDNPRIVDIPDEVVNPFIKVAPASLSRPYLFKTDFPALDEALGGGIPLGSLVCIIGPHKVGKTAFISRIRNYQKTENIMVYNASNRDKKHNWALGFTAPEPIQYLNSCPGGYDALTLWREGKLTSGLLEIDGSIRNDTNMIDALSDFLTKVRRSMSKQSVFILTVPANKGPAANEENNPLANLVDILISIEKLDLHRNVVTILKSHCGGRKYSFRYGIE